MNLISIILRLPFWVFFLAAGAVVWFGEEARKDAVQYEIDKATALESGPPAARDAATFDRSRDVGPADEVNIQGWIEYDYNYHLTLQKKGADTERFVLMIFGNTDRVGAKTVRAALVLTEKERDKFLQLAESWVTGVGGKYGELMTFNGFARRSADLDDMFDDALKDEGLRRAGNFIFIEPFLEGRAAALAPTPNRAGQLAGTAYGVAAILALFGAGKFLFGRLVAPPPSAREEALNELAQTARQPISAQAPRVAPQNSQLAELYERYGVPPDAAPPVAPAPVEAKRPAPNPELVAQVRSVIEEAEPKPNRFKKPVLFVIGLAVLFGAPSGLARLGLDPTPWLVDVSSSLDGAGPPAGLGMNRAVLSPDKSQPGAGAPTGAQTAPRQPTQPETAAADPAGNAPAPAALGPQQTDPVLLGFAALAVLLAFGFAYVAVQAMRGQLAGRPQDPIGRADRGAKHKLSSDPFARLQAEPR